MAKQPKRKNNYSKKRKKRFSPIQILVISIILFLFLIVILFTILRFVHTTQNLVESKVNSLAKDYYENHIYEELAQKNKPDEIAKTLKKYETSGLSIVHLRQLLNHNNQADMTKYLSEQCDTEKTFVKYYPESPYSKKSYHIDIVYSCDF